MAGVPDVPTTPVDIQQKLDEWLAGEPEAQKYLAKIWYVPEGQRMPAGVTHKVRLNSLASEERALSLGLEVKPPYAAFVDMLLAMIATQPQGR